MNPHLADLLGLLQLEQLEDRLFRGQSRDIGSAQVFGGQVLGQALRAAYATTQGRVQHGEQIFHMAASFQVPEPGLDHQLPMPDCPAPETLPRLDDLPLELREQLPAAARRLLRDDIPFEFRLVQSINYAHPAREAPRQDVWLRAKDVLPDDPLLQQCLLAYVSDYHLIATAMRPHGICMATPGVVVASIDHAMWFHRPVRVDDWLLYSMDSPSASGARGFARASLFNRQGVLVASTAQEGLLRVVKPQ